MLRDSHGCCRAYVQIPRSMAKINNRLSYTGITHLARRALQRRGTTGRIELSAARKLGNRRMPGYGSFAARSQHDIPFGAWMKCEDRLPGPEAITMRLYIAGRQIGAG